MKITILVSYLAALALAWNGNSTPWTEEPITAMAENIRLIYNQSVILYNQRTMFDAPHAPCQAPSLAGQSNNTVCSKADQLAGPSQQLVVNAWHEVAADMFPVSYGQPPYPPDHYHSIYSDFSHYYNFLYIQISYIVNITQYYTCYGNFRKDSSTYNGYQAAYFSNQDYPVVLNGPRSSPPSHNGTFWEPSGYKTGSFYDSFHHNEHRMRTSYENGLELITNPTSEISFGICADFQKNGIQEPPFPTGFSLCHNGDCSH